MEGSHEFPGIEDKPFFDTVIDAFGDIKVCTERKNRGELSDEPGMRRVTGGAQRKSLIIVLYLQGVELFPFSFILLASVSFLHGMNATEVSLNMLLYYADKSPKYQEAWE